MSSSVGNSTFDPFLKGSGVRHADLGCSTESLLLMKGSRLLFTKSNLILIPMFVDVPSRSSSAVNQLKVDLLNGLAFVEFKNGRVYAYSNIPPNEIFSVLFNTDISLGFWVNRHLVQSETSHLMDGDEFDYHQFDSSKVELPSFV